MVHVDSSVIHVAVLIQVTGWEASYCCINSLYMECAAALTEGCCCRTCRGRGGGQEGGSPATLRSRSSGSIMYWMAMYLYGGVEAVRCVV